MSDTSPSRDNDQGQTEDDAQNVPEKPKYFKGQRVFAKDETSGILYEAIVRRTMHGMARQRKQIHLHDFKEEEEEDKEEWHCFVHYLGWNVSWDRWVSEGSLYELTDKNRDLAKKLQDAVKEAKKKHGRKSPHIMVELTQRMKQLEQERRLEERREELAQQGIVMQKEDEQQAVAESNTATNKFTKAYFKKELALREQDLQGKRKQSHAERLVLPFSLKKVLVEEWEVITQCGMIPTLPVDDVITVQQVLKDYLESKIGKPTSVNATDATTAGTAAAGETVAAAKVDEPAEAQKQSIQTDGHVTKVNPEGNSESKDNPAAGVAEGKSEPPPIQVSEKDEVTKKQEQEWQDMVDGIALLFDQAVDARLLYRQELPLREWVLQHDDLGTRRNCQVYGCEHLLRLFIRLPALLADQLSDAESRPILSKLNDFVRYLSKHQDKIFLQSYQPPPEELVSRKRPSDGTSATKRSAKRSRKAPLKKARPQGVAMKDPPPPSSESNGVEAKATVVAASCGDDATTESDNAQSKASSEGN